MTLQNVGNQHRSRIAKGAHECLSLDPDAWAVGCINSIRRDAHDGENQSSGALGPSPNLTKLSSGKWSNALRAPDERADRQRRVVWRHSPLQSVDCNRVPSIEGVKCRQGDCDGVDSVHRGA
eukprot:738577-Rhodomonas_salina.1